MMTHEEAKYILGEMQNLQFYTNKVNELWQLLNDLSEHINDVQTPSSPNGGNGVKIENHADKASMVLSLYSDEILLVDEYQMFLKRKQCAEAYRQSLLDACEDSDIPFVTDCIKRIPYRVLNDKYYIANSYAKIIRMIQKMKK